MNYGKEGTFFTEPKKRNKCVYWPLEALKHLQKLTY